MDYGQFRILIDLIFPKENFRTYDKPIQECLKILKSPHLYNFDTKVLLEKIYHILKISELIKINSRYDPMKRFRQIVDFEPYIPVVILLVFYHVNQNHNAIVCYCNHCYYENGVAWGEKSLQFETDYILLTEFGREHIIEYDKLNNIKGISYDVRQSLGNLKYGN